MSDDPILAALSRLEAGQSTMQRRLTDVQHEQATVQHGLSSVQHELTRLRVDLMERMDRLQNTLTSVQDDMKVTMGAADAAQRVNDNTREDLRALREQVTIMWRQLKAVEARVREIDGMP